MTRTAANMGRTPRLRNKDTPHVTLEVGMRGQVDVRGVWSRDGQPAVGPAHRGSGDALAWVRSEMTIDGSGHGVPGGVGSSTTTTLPSAPAAPRFTPNDPSRGHCKSTVSSSTQTKDLRSLAGFGGPYSSVQSPLTFRFTSALNPSTRFRSLPRQSSLPTGPMTQL